MQSWLSLEVTWPKPLSGGKEGRKQKTGEKVPMPEKRDAGQGIELWAKRTAHSFEAPNLNEAQSTFGKRQQLSCIDFSPRESTRCVVMEGGGEFVEADQF